MSADDKRVKRQMKRAARAVPEKAVKKQKPKRDPSKPKQVPKTLESKRIFDPEQLMDEETVPATF